MVGKIVCFAVLLGFGRTAPYPDKRSSEDGFFCYHCDEATDNSACQTVTKCPDGRSRCLTQVMFHEYGLLLAKRCAAMETCYNHEEKNPKGCDNPDEELEGYCTYCCDTPGCNRGLPPYRSSIQPHRSPKGQEDPGGKSPGHLGPGVNPLNQVFSGVNPPAYSGPGVNQQGPGGPGGMSPGHIGPGGMSPGHIGPGGMSQGPLGPGVNPQGHVGPGGISPGHVGPGVNPPDHVGPGIHPPHHVGSGVHPPHHVGPGMNPPGNIGHGGLSAGHIGPGGLSPGHSGGMPKVVQVTSQATQTTLGQTTKSTTRPSTTLTTTSGKSRSTSHAAVKAYPTSSPTHRSSTSIQSTVTVGNHTRTQTVEITSPTRMSSLHQTSTPTKTTGVITSIETSTKQLTPTQISGVSCQVCGDWSAGTPCTFMDIMIPRYQTCKGGQYCMTDAVWVNNVGTSNLYKRCVSEAVCNRDWYHETSDKSLCVHANRVNPPKQTLCHYCCTKPRCNQGVMPDVSTLFAP